VVGQIDTANALGSLPGGARPLDSNRDSNRAVTPPASGERSGVSHRGADVTDADGGLARIYGSEDQDRETGSPSGSQIAQPTSDDHGAQTAVLGVKADPPDQSGRLVETYGSEGWEFESLRVRHWLT
jgi:hypothetical protein